MKGTRFLAFLLAFVLAFSSIGVADVSAAETLSGNQVTEETLSGNRVDSEDVQAPEEEPVVEEEPMVKEKPVVLEEEIIVQKEAAQVEIEGISVQIDVRNVEEDYSWLFNDETLDVNVSVENLPEGATVEAVAGKFDWENQEGNYEYSFTEFAGDDYYAYDEENRVIRLYGAKIVPALMSENVEEFGVRVIVRDSEGNEIFGKNPTWLFYAGKAWIDYNYPWSYPGDNIMLIGESIDIGKHLNCWGENGNYPYGTNQWVEITSLTVSEIQHSYESGDGAYDIIGVEDCGSEGWKLHGNNMGYAEVTIKFYDWFHGDEEQKRTFTVYSDGIKGELFLEYPNDNNMLLRGQEKEIPTSLKFRYIDDDGNHQEEWIDDYTLSFVVYEEGKEPELVQSFAGEYVSFTTDGKTINAKASDERYGWDNVDIKVNYTFHDKEFECDSRIDMGVTGTYFSIDTIKDVNNVEVGDTIDMDDYINVYQYKEGWDGPLNVIKKADNSLNDRKHRIRITWDKDVWEAIGEDESDPVPKLKRISPEHGTITVIPQCTEPEGTEGYDANEYTDYGGFERRFEFHGLDYSVRFETDHYSVFKGEDNFFELNTENLTDKNIKSFDVQIGWFMGKEDEPVIFEEDGLYTLVYEDDETTIKGITLHGAELEKLTDSMRDGRDFDVKILVKNAYEDVSVFKQTWAFTMEDTEINYDYQYYGISMLPYEDRNIDKEFGCSIKNTQYPEGEDVRVQVIDASLELLDGTPEGVITLSPWVDENNSENYRWNIHAENYGHAKVTITYNLPVGEGTGTHTFDVWCGTDVWEMDLSTNTGSNNLLPGASLDLIATLNHKCHTERDGHFWGSIDNVEYEWNYNENVREDLVTFEQDSANPNVLHVQANANAETGQNTWIHVRAYTWDENGERYEAAYADFELWVHEGYCEIRPKNEVHDDYEIAEVFTIEPELWNVEKDREDFNISKAGEVEVAFRWNYDPDALEFDEENYTFKRLKAYQTDINLEAGLMIDGEFQSRAWRRFRLQELNYDIRLQLDYNEEQERERNWLYASENYTVGIDSNCLDGKDLAELIVQVGRFTDEEHFEEFGETSGIYTLERDTEGTITGITLHGSVLKEFFGESDDRNFHVRYYVESNGEFAEDTERYQLMYLEYPWEECEFPNDTYLLLGDDMYVSKEVNAHYHDKDEPFGKDTKVWITNLKIRNQFAYGGEDDPQPTAKSIIGVYKDGNDGWILKGEDHGYANIEITYLNVYGEENNYVFSVSSSGDDYELRLLYPDDCIRMAYHSEEIVEVQFIRRYLDERHNQCEEVVTLQDGEFYRLKFWNGDEWAETFEDDIASYKQNEDNQSFVINSNGIDGARTFAIAAEIVYLDENGEEQTMWADTEYCLEVYGEVCQIEFENEIDTLVGVDGTFDIRAAGPKVYVEKGGNQKNELAEGTNIYFEVDFDENAWAVEENENADDAIPVLRRKETWQTGVDLIAKRVEDDEEIARRHFEFYDYSVEFKHLRGDGHTWVFTDEYDYTMELDMSKLSGVPGIEVEWVVGDNKFDREANCTSAEYEQYKVSDDKLSITLNGYRLKNEGDEAVEWLYSFDEVWVRAIIKSVERDSEGKVLSEKTLNVYDTYVAIRHPKYLLDGEEDSEMTFWEGDGWIYEDNVIGAYVENGTYPYGRYVELYIDDITVVNDDGENPAFTLYTDRDRGYWNISAQRLGCASVSFNLSHARFGVQNIVKRIYSSKEVYQLHVYSDTGSHTMSPDDTMTLVTELYRYTRDRKGNVVETYVPREEYKLNYFDYSTHNIEINSLTGLVTAKECGNTSVRVEAKSTTNDDVFYDGFNFDIEVSKDYTALYGEKYYAEPGSINDISKFDIRIVRKYYNENGEYVEEPYEVEDARFADTGNANYFWLAWWNQKLVVNDEINRTLPTTNRVDIIAEHDGQLFEGWVNVVICEHDYRKETVSGANEATITYDYCAKCQHVKNYKTFYLSKTSYTFNGGVQKPSVVVLDKEGKTLDSKYYSVSYPSGCKNAGTYKVTIKFKGEYSGSETLSYTINAKKITPVLTLSKTEFTYNGKTQTPTVTVKDGATKLTANTDYTVSYSSGSKNVGKYTVTVTLKGNYSGTKSLTYTIIPKGTSISKVTAASKAFTVKWKKQATQTTGYQIQYSTSSKFSGAKTVTVKGTSTVSKAVKKLKAKKKYYVRVRTYKTVSGVTYYSSWSGAKSVKTK